MRGIGVCVLCTHLFHCVHVCVCEWGVGGWGQQGGGEGMLPMSVRTILQRWCCTGIECS